MAVLHSKLIGQPSLLPPSLPPLQATISTVKNNGTELKGKVLSVDEDQIVIISSKTKQVVKTPVRDILGVQAKRFSVGTSIGIPAAALIAAIVIYTAFGEQPSSPIEDQ